MSDVSGLETASEAESNPADCLPDQFDTDDDHSNAAAAANADANSEGSSELDLDFNHPKELESNEELDFVTPKISTIATPPKQILRTTRNPSPERAAGSKSNSSLKVVDEFNLDLIHQISNTTCKAYGELTSFPGCTNSTAIGFDGAQHSRWDNVVIRKKAIVMFRARSGKSAPLYKGIVAIYSRLLYVSFKTRH